MCLNQVVLYPIKNSTNSSDVPYLTGSNFVSVYSLVQIVFHWGYNDYQGSEHQLNSIKYPLEVNIVEFLKENFFLSVSKRCSWYIKTRPVLSL